MVLGGWVVGCGEGEGRALQADIVLTQPGLSTIVVALTTARKIFKRIDNFVLYRCCE